MPDVKYSVNYWSRYQSCYDAMYFKYAMRILKYLYKTKDLKLIYYDNLKYETLDWMVENGTIDIVKIDTSLNLADMLTKSLDKTKFVKNRNALKLIV